MKRIKNFAKYLRFWRYPKKFWIPGLISLLLIVWFFIIPHNQAATAPQFATAKREDIKATVASSGVLTGRDSASLRFKSGGKLAYLSVKPGDTITRGQVIAGLDTQDLNISLQQAQNTLRDKQTALEKVLDDIHQVQYGNNWSGQTETETQKQARTSAEVSRDSAVDSVKAAQRSYQDAVLVSPIDGVVTTAPIIPGQYVSGSDVVAQVVDWTNGVYFDTDIDEADISKITGGQTAEVTLNAYPDQTFTGKVAEIKPQTKTTTSGATVVTVRINLGHPTVQLIANLNGQASIVTQQVLNAIAIPQEALTDDNKVVVRTNKGFETRDVTPGIRSDTDVEIVKGLQDKDQVITNPARFVNNGQQRSNNPLTRLFRQFSPRRT